MSSSPDWDVYEFRLHGIKYLQFTRNGVIHAVIGMVGGATFVVPMGVDAQNVSEATLPSSSAAQVVYSGANTKVTAIPQSSGATVFTLQTCDQKDCGGPGVTSQIK